MLKYLLLILVTLSCSQVSVLNSEKENITDSSSQEVEKLQTMIPMPLVQNIHKITLQPGKVKFVVFDINLENGLKKTKCGKETLSFVVQDQKAKLFMTESYFSGRKKTQCTYDGKVIVEVKIKEFPYKSEKLNVDKKRVTLSQKDLNRVIKERKILKKVYLNSSSYFLFDKPFNRPLNSYVTSHYGNRRLFNNKKKSQHLGNDLRAAVGVPIPVANKGKVIFTGHLFYSGNVVIVDHGLGLYTTYGHLSKINVTKGMVINQNDIVGLAGATGRVSGPHLHWGVKLNGHWVDGFSLVDESKKMFLND
jgi:murein DD-endopeptidase MepM/ murein hydrolase activator NlpD